MVTCELLDEDPDRDDVLDTDEVDMEVELELVEEEETEWDELLLDDD